MTFVLRLHLGGRQCHRRFRLAGRRARGPLGGGPSLVTYGLLVTAVLVLVGLPNAPNKVTYLVLYAAVSLVEGMLPVATPALIRDFSPQLGRASAMGFWTLGPVIGGLVVTEVSSNTLGSHPHWQTQSDRPARARLTGLSLPATRIPQWAGRRCRSLSRVIPSLEGTRPPSAAGQSRRGRDRKITT